MGSISFESRVIICISVVSSILSFGHGLAQAHKATLEAKDEDQRDLLTKIADKFANSVHLPFFFEKILLDVIPTFLGQRPCNEHDTFEAYKSYIMDDHSNDDIEDATVHQIIRRSGYRYKSYKVLSDDGYETELVRIINPKADRKKLKSPPVMIMHGGIIDPTAYVWASAIQHHPEKYPRTVEDGPITSSNRSVAFTLSNNGYDVWLVFTRGSDPKHQKKSSTKSVESLVTGKFARKNNTLGESLFSATQVDYWMYSFDHIVTHEVPAQIMKVLKITKQKKVTLFAYSFSTIISLSLFASQPEFCERHIHNHVQMAPILTDRGASHLIRWIYQDFLVKAPALLGNRVGTELFIPATRMFLKVLMRFRGLFYGLGKFLVSLFVGTSAKWRTFLEPAVVSHVFIETGYMQIKHYMQQVIAGQLQKFDFGRAGNLAVYKQEEPPVHDLTQIRLKNWMLITASNDNLATPESSEELLSLYPYEPLRHIYIEGYNHLDLAAAVDNAKLVNMPVLEFLEETRFRSDSEFE